MNKNSISSKHNLRVSVLMCVHNGEAYLSEAIESVLKQTFSDFEFVIVDDGSDDSTADIISGFQDDRIVYVHNKHDYISSLNLGLRTCKGGYIARMDADDRMRPERLQKQLGVLDSYPEVAVCCSWAAAFGTRCGVVGVKVKEYVDNPYLWLATGNYLIHPTSMIRKDFLKAHRLYYKRYSYAEDYKLWADITKRGGAVYVIPEMLLDYRINPSQVSNVHKEEQEITRLKISQEIIEELIHRLPASQRKVVSCYYNSMITLNCCELMQGDIAIAQAFKVIKNIMIQKAD